MERKGTGKNRPTSIKRSMLFAVLGLALILLLTSCTTYMRSSLNYKDIGTENNMHFYGQTIGKTCFVCQCEWDGTEEGTSIHIPDTYDGYTVTTLGGYAGSGVPLPFRIALPDDYVTSYVYSYLPDKSQFAHEYTVQHLQFTLYLGANISEMQYVKSKEYYAFENEDGSITFTHPAVYIICDESNEHFYSADGKLYNKSDDTLIDVFDYYSDFVEAE